MIVIRCVLNKYFRKRDVGYSPNQRNMHDLGKLNLYLVGGLGVWRLQAVKAQIEQSGIVSVPEMQHLPWPWLSPLAKTQVARKMAMMDL